MNLLIAYLMIAIGILIDIRQIQWLIVIFSILIYYVLVAHRHIGGDYLSLQLRADSNDAGEIIFGLDIVFQILVQISKFINVDISILYATLMFFFLSYNIKRPYIVLFQLIISYYFLITGFQRQALAAFIFARSFAFNKSVIVYIISFLTHNSAILLIALSFCFSKKRTSSFSVFVGLLMFVAILVFGKVFVEGTFMHHYIQFYFFDKMESAGVIFRLLAIILVYFTLVYRNLSMEDNMCRIFEALIVYSMCMIVIGATTAGDRTLIFASAILIFSQLVRNASNVRLAMASIPFVIMNISWIFMSEKAQVHW